MIWKKQPVGSKLSDLQNNKASKDTATQNAAGLMSAADKTKLDGVATGATAVSVVNNLNSDSTTSALSAAQGKALNSKVDAQITVFVQLFNQNIEGTSTAAAETTFDLSSYIPSGYSLWSVEMQIQEGSAFYNLPWWNDGFTQSTRIQRLTNTSIIIRNQAKWSANTSITFTLHCKKT